jgi:hypothetical protein
MRPTRLLAALALGALLAGCGGSSATGPTAGNLKVQLATPNSDDGAILFRIVGPGITSVQAGPGLTPFTRISTNQDTAVVILAGNVAAGQVATIAVPDISKVGQYSTSLTQVTGRTAPYTQRSLGGYSMQVTH